MRDDIDAYLAAAFQDVPVPKGLAERLLDRLAADAATGDSIAHQDAYPTRQIASYNRRWLLVGGGLLAVAAGLLIAVWLGPRSETRSFRADGPQRGDSIVRRGVQRLRATVIGSSRRSFH